MDEKDCFVFVKDVFVSECCKVKVFNFSIVYGKIAYGLAKDWGTFFEEVVNMVEFWYVDCLEV